MLSLKNDSHNQYTTILWDWNGTLLNDTDVSIATINELLSKRKHPLLTKETYQEVFDFPVIEYYKKIGFDFESESWTDVAAEYMQSYHAKEDTFSLFEEAKETLAYFNTKGYQQYILSAMKTESIKKMLIHFSINSYFDGVYGQDNHYANGKKESGLTLLKENHLLSQDCLLIGDTTHDAQVADEIGINCMLFTQGHHNEKRLKSTNKRTFSNFRELINKF